ncbi:MAG: arginyltransferase [Polyangiaceae bacterium]|nr:arginyltransferase [Polyangiaceae bacterium]
MFDIRVLLDREPTEYVIFDNELDCPYLDGRLACFPVRIPVRALELWEFDRTLARGDRRHGDALYAPECYGCGACEAIRIDVGEFRPSRSQRRAQVRGDAVLRVERGEIEVDQERVELYELHLRGRGLSIPGDTAMTVERYSGFVENGLTSSFEIRLFLGDALVGVAVTDRGEDSLSAHYTYYNPEYPHLSLGTYMIMEQLRIVRELGARYLYLGLHVEQCVHMNYKARFRPHERLIGGSWQRIGDRDEMDQKAETDERHDKK